MPESIGRYEVIDHIGTGAMADIYRARDPEIDREVAVKILKAGLDNEDDLERFLREARAAGALTHPNIVTIHDVGKVDDAPYITMELLEGQTLEDMLLVGHQLTELEVIEIAIDLAQALEYAHGQGVVHRDIKPSNILFLPGTKRPKIADFGIARLESTEEGDKTQSGVVIGTPRYMSPEQALGQETDGRTDLFALGVVLFELLTGAKAFDAPTTTSLLLKIAREEPRSFKEVDRDVPAGLQQIVRKLLHKNPDRRFQTGAEVVAALTRERDNAAEREADAARNKYVPLRVKWAAIMGAIVAVVLGASIFTVITLQAGAIRDQVYDSGSSLAKFIATEAAVAVLGEDWIRLETFVSEALRRETFEYLVISDHTGTVRATTSPDLVIEDNPTRETLRDEGGVLVSELSLNEEVDVFDFETPVLFQDTPVGTIHLGLTTESLDDVMATTRGLMLLLGVVTLTAVIGMLYVFGSLLTKPLRLLARSMDVFSRGEWDHRTSSVRNDEIGHLFSAFNKMADAIQTAVRDPQSGPDVDAHDATPEVEDESSLERTVILKKEDD